MLQIDVITLFPEMIEDAATHGVLGQALKNQLLKISTHTPRDFTEDRHRTVDDRPFGGGDGMILLAEPLRLSLEKVKHKNSRVIYMSPQGVAFTDQKARQLAGEEHLVILCGRYGGVDQRFLNQYVDEEISIGDYVLSGGELGALVVIDALSRFIPGVLGHEDSAEKDSFASHLLEHPNFTRPREWQGQGVPEILFSGHHQRIEDWTRKVAVLVTLKKRPDLCKKFMKISPLDLEELREFWNNLSAPDKISLGLADLSEDDFHV